MMKILSGKWLTIIIVQTQICHTVVAQTFAGCRSCFTAKLQ